MTIKAVFIQQGMMIGELVKDEDETVTIKNPILVIAKQNEILLAPFLQMVEEKEVILKKSDLTFGQTFTPKQELANRFNQIFGSGLVVTNSLTF